MYWIILFFIFLFLNKLIKYSLREKKVNLLTTKDNSSNVYSKETFTIYRPNDSLHGHRCFVDNNLTEYELVIVKKLARNLDPSNYYIFNNVIVPSSVTITSQIDHIIVSKFGIFVIENKNLRGWVFGNKNWSRWTQSFTAKSKFEFQNPIFQNHAHICALKEQLPFLNIKNFHNVVVFSDDCKFKTPIPENVIRGNELINYLLSKDKILINEAELLMTIGKISMLCQNNQIPLSEHINNLSDRVE